MDVPPGEKRPEFGCFNIGTVKALQFPQAAVYWHLRAFGSRQAAEAARSATGIVVEEDGRAWLSEFGARDAAPRGGEAVAVIGPLEFPAGRELQRRSLLYAVMRPGEQSASTHTPGPGGLVCARGRAVPGDARRREQGWRGTDHGGATERSNGTERHRYDAPAGVCPGHP